MLLKSFLWLLFTYLALDLATPSCGFASTLHLHVCGSEAMTKLMYPSKFHPVRRNPFLLSVLRGGVSTETKEKHPIDSSLKLTPITLLSGFLGTGKTSTLKHILENKAGLKVGVVVNDVAEVNIDARLIRGLGAVAKSTAVELQNGCACCSASEELLTSVQDLVSLGRTRYGPSHQTHGVPRPKFPRFAPHPCGSLQPVLRHPCPLPPAPSFTSSPLSPPLPRSLPPAPSGFSSQGRALRPHPRRALGRRRARRRPPQPRRRRRRGGPRSHPPPRNSSFPRRAQSPCAMRAPSPCRTAARVPPPRRK